MHQEITGEGSRKEAPSNSFIEANKVELLVTVQQDFEEYHCDALCHMEKTALPGLLVVIFTL